MADYPWKTILCAAYSWNLYTSIYTLVCVKRLLPMETRSWPPVGRSHWPQCVGKTFWRETPRPESFFRLLQKVEEKVVGEEGPPSQS